MSTRKNTKSKNKTQSPQTITYIKLVSYSLDDLFSSKSKGSLVDYGYFKNMVHTPSLKFYFEVLNEFAFGLLLFVGLFLGTIFTGASVSQYAAPVDSSFANENQNAYSHKLAMENVTEAVLGASTENVGCSFSIDNQLVASTSDYSIRDNTNLYVCTSGVANSTNSRWFLVDNVNGGSTPLVSQDDLSTGASCATVEGAFEGKTLNVKVYELGNTNVNSCYLNFVE